MINSHTETDAHQNKFRFPVYAFDQYLNAFWHNVGAENVSWSNDRTFEAIKCALTILILKGARGKNYNDFCEYLSIPLNLELGELQSIYLEYRKYLVKHEDRLTLKHIFGFKLYDIDRLSAFEALQYSAGFIKRIMRQHNYKDENSTKLKTVAFTGPRPEKLPSGLNIFSLKNALTQAIQTAIADGYSVFFSGMSRGVDLLAAECVTQLMECDSNIKLRCAAPFKGQENRWNSADRDHYSQIMSKADRVDCVSANASRRAYLLRNEFMIDRSERLIAVYDGKSGGGTAYTINYAEMMGVEVVYIDPSKL